ILHSAFGIDCDAFFSILLASVPIPFPCRKRSSHLTVVVPAASVMWRYRPIYTAKRTEGCRRVPRTFDSWTGWAL
ncbi:MAG: hypothetical protein C5B57_06990, partial [Blastocatellia bacterium]